MSAPPTQPAPTFLTMGDVQRILEVNVLAAGVGIYDHKLVSNPSRIGLHVYADVKGTEVYKVRIDLEEGRPGVQKARCSCPRSRFTPICKHAAAVVVAWASAPGSFVEVQGAELPEAEAEGKKRRRQPARGKVDTAEQVANGLAALEALLSELAHTGLGTLTQERVDRIRDLANNLRPLRLRRLAPACIELASQLQGAVPESEAQRQFGVMVQRLGAYRLPQPKRPPFSAEEYARRIADLTFQIRGLARLMKREDTDAEDYRRLADELLGRTWSEKQLTSVAGLRLLDLCWRKHKTPDGFVVEESLLVDVTGGEIYSDKLIRPPMIARRQGPKEDFARALLEVADAGLYPGYPPCRLKLRRFERRPPAPQDLEGLWSRVPATVEAVCEGFRTSAADPFAPTPFYVAFLPSTLLVRRDRLFGLDPSGGALSLDLRDFGYDAFEDAVRQGPVRLLFGTVDTSRGALDMRLLAAVTVSDRGVAVTSASGEGPSPGPAPEEPPAGP